MVAALGGLPGQVLGEVGDDGGLGALGEHRAHPVGEFGGPVERQVRIGAAQGDGGGVHLGLLAHPAHRLGAVGEGPARAVDGHAEQAELDRVGLAGGAVGVAGGGEAEVGEPVGGGGAFGGAVLGGEPPRA